MIYLYTYVDKAIMEEETNEGSSHASFVIDGGVDDFFNGGEDASFVGKLAGGGFAGTGIR